MYNCSGKLGNEQDIKVKMTMERKKKVIKNVAKVK